MWCYATYPAQLNNTSTFVTSLEKSSTSSLFVTSNRRVTMPGEIQQGQVSNPRAVYLDWFGECQPAFHSLHVLSAKYAKIH